MIQRLRDGLSTAEIDAVLAVWTAKETAVRPWPSFLELFPNRVDRDDKVLAQLAHANRYGLRYGKCHHPRAEQLANAMGVDQDIIDESLSELEHQGRVGRDRNQRYYAKGH